MSSRGARRPRGSGTSLTRAYRRAGPSGWLDWPGSRALTVGDYHDAWITVDKAIKGKTVPAVVRGTKTGEPKRLPVSEALQEWIERHVRPDARLTRSPLFPNPRSGQPWAHKALARVWGRAVEVAGLRVGPPGLEPGGRGKRISNSR
jgi:hypothetical protein